VGRNVALRVASRVEQLWHFGSPELMPPAHLRTYYYRTWSRAAFTRASEGAAAELISRGLRREDRLLDIGSGIGNLAIGLLDYLHGRYEGIEIYPEAVAWCQRSITPAHPAFKFHHADLFSRAYNPHGRAVAAQYVFPFDDALFDVVFLGSVFTHLLPDAVRQYVKEISRMLAPQGTCVASCFLLNDESRAGIDAGRSFMSFPPAAPATHRVHDASIPEAAVALDEIYMRQVLADAGLAIREIRRGVWHNGVADDQDVITATKSSSTMAPHETRV
jgi:SAM-dependent methyltransferase